MKELNDLRSIDHADPVVLVVLSVNFAYIIYFGDVIQSHRLYCM